MALQLNDEEVAIVRRLIESELAQLNPEIQHTATTAVRDELRQLQLALQALLARVRAAQDEATDNTPNSVE